MEKDAGGFWPVDGTAGKSVAGQNTGRACPGGRLIGRRIYAGCDPVMLPENTRITL